MGRVGRIHSKCCYERKFPTELDTRMKEGWDGRMHSKCCDERKFLTELALGIGKTQDQWDRGRMELCLIGNTAYVERA